MFETVRQTIHDLLLSTGLGAAGVYHLTLVLLYMSIGIVCWLVGLICQVLIIPSVHFVVKRTNNTTDDILINRRLLKAVSRIIPMLLFTIMVPLCLREGEREPLTHTIVLHLGETLLTLSFIWVITAFLNNLSNYAEQNENLKDYHLESVIQFIKLVIYCLGTIVIIALLFNENPLTLFAGLGAAATILLLIFRDSILGLVASIQLSVNKMVKKDDWIIIESKNVNGTVEEVNLTTVKVRNFDNSVSMIPPYSLVSDSFQNWGCMYEEGKRRVKRSILIDTKTIKFTDKSKTTTNLAQFRQHAEEYLRNHPNVINSEWLMARELEPTAHGLPVELWFYFNETEFVKFEQLASEVLEYLIAILPTFGLQIYQYTSEPYGK